MENQEAKFTQCDCGRMIQISVDDKTVRVLDMPVNYTGESEAIFSGEKCPTCNSVAANKVSKDSWFFKWALQAKAEMN